MFQRSGATWTEQQVLQSPAFAAGALDVFGSSVAVLGNTIIIGVPGDTVGANFWQGSACAFTYVPATSTWTLEQHLTDGGGAFWDWFGYAVSLTTDTALIGAPLDDVGGAVDQGSAFVFTRTAGAWSLQQQLSGPGGVAHDGFGWSVGISQDLAVVGTPFSDPAGSTDRGVVHPFQFVAGTWTAETVISGAAHDNDRFGASVALAGDIAVIGVPLWDVAAQVDVGSAVAHYHRRPPLVTSIVPTSGPVAGGTTVTIAGNYFDTLGSGPDVTFGGVTAPAGVCTTTSITTTTPAHSAGIVDVVVTNNDGQSGTLVNAFTYVPPPAISTVAPSSGTAAGGTAITITGTGFQAGATVTVNTQPATGVTFVSPTTLTAVTPPGPGGAAVDVVVGNPDGQSDTLWGGFTYVCVYAISPTSQSFPAVGGAGSIQITTSPGCGWQATETGGFIIVTVTSGNGSGTLDYSVPSNGGAARTGTITIEGLTCTISQAAAPLPPPEIHGVWPDTGPTTGTTTKIGGTGFQPGATVTIGGLPATVTAVDYTSMSIVVPPHAPGHVDVVVTNPDSQSATLSQCFCYLTYQYLAEGATGDFFDLDIAIANPTTSSRVVTTEFMREDGQVFTFATSLAPMGRDTMPVDYQTGLESTAVSTVVKPQDLGDLLVARTMFWDSSWYGGHSAGSVDSPGTSWYFAEGSQGFFDAYVLLANANASPADMTVSFLTEYAGPVVRTYTVQPTSRMNVFTGAIPELAGKSFSIVVTSTLPIIAERAMYFGTVRMWDGGHESMGVKAPATSWFHAEGATGTFFDTYILIGNPNAGTANLTLRFLLDTGQTVTRTYALPGNARLTVNVEDQDPLLASAAVSTTVSSDLPVISERAMYWPGAFTEWTEAHNSFGLTQTATRWGLAEGRVGANWFETYILLANPNASPAQVRITFLRPSGQTPIVRDYVVAPTSRYNVWVNGMVPELCCTFGAIVESTNGVPIAVEEAMYWDALGIHWAGGTNLTATPLP